MSQVIEDVINMSYDGQLVLVGLVRHCQLVWQIDDANGGELLMFSI